MKPSKKDIERVEKIVTEHPTPTWTDGIVTALIAKALAEERERCAGIADEYGFPVARLIAKAIRRNDEEV